MFTGWSSVCHFAISIGVFMFMNTSRDVKNSEKGDTCETGACAELKLDNEI